MADTLYDAGAEPAPALYPIPYEQQEPMLPDNIVQLQEWAMSDNVAGQVDDDTLRMIGQQAHEKYEIDDESRSEWKKTAQRSLELIGGKRESKNYPFPGAANVRYPLLHSAVVQFASRSYPAILKGPDLVKVKVEGKDFDGAKMKRAQRIEKFMSYQLLHQMEEWEEDTDALLHQLPLIGCAFRKTYWDGAKGRPKSELVPALDLVVNINVPSLEAAPQIAHEKFFYPHEIKERVAKGWFIDVDLGEAEGQRGEEGEHTGTGNDPNAPHKFLECHLFFDLDGDGVAEPWIATVHDDTQKVVRLAACYDPEAIEHDEDGRVLNIERDHYFTKYEFWPDPKGGFYGMGLGHALEDISETINTTLNQMIDAGTLQNAGGGFIGSGLDVKKATMRFEPGKYHTVHAPGSTIRDAIVNMQHPGPSSTLFQLLGVLIDVGKEISGNREVLSGEVSTNMQPTTLMALIEQGLQQFTAVYKRIYRALGKEFQRLRGINAEYLTDEIYNRYLDDDEAGMASVAEDFGEGDLDIYPVANPNIVTNMQRAAQNQLLLELTQHPLLGKHLVPPDILRRILMHAQIEDVDKVINPEPQPSLVEQAQMRQAEAQAEKAEAESRLTQAQIIKIKQEVEKSQADIAKTAVEGAKAYQEADRNALETSIIEQLASRIDEFKKVEDVSIQGVGSIKEHDRDPKAVSGSQSQQSDASE